MNRGVNSDFADFAVELSVNSVQYVVQMCSSTHKKFNKTAVKLCSRYLFTMPTPKRALALLRGVNRTSFSLWRSGVHRSSFSTAYKTPQRQASVEFPEKMGTETERNSVHSGSPTSGRNRVGKGSLTGRWEPRLGGCPNIRGGITIDRNLRAGTKLWLTGWTETIAGGEVVSLLVEIAGKGGRPRQ